MANGDTQPASAFHDATKLSYINLLTKPSLYKSYPGATQISLAETQPPEMPALDAILNSSTPSAAPLDVAAISQLLHYTAGLIKKRDLPVAGEVHYRAAASAGALYPIELYLVCGEIDGLNHGVYHYCPADNALIKLREGDFRGNLAAAAADESLASTPAIVVSTAVFWRTAWKYRTRGYRYCFWDNGTILSNLLASANSQGQPARVLAGFVDADVDKLLGVDSEQEASTCLVALGQGFGAKPYVVKALEEIDKGDICFSEAVSYPESEILHAQSCLSSADEVRDWRYHGHIQQARFSADAKSDALRNAILDRGSTRRFSREDIEMAQFTALLAASSANMPADFECGITEPYLIVNAVKGLDSGAYYFSRSTGELELLDQGEFRNEAGHLCFEQALGADASAVIYFMADLDKILDRYGNRGYRAAQLEAGVMGGNVYLAAHALGLGATGMTFFDDAVTAFFSPHAAGKSLMFLVALGRTATPNRVRPFRSKYGVLKDSLARGAKGDRRPVPDWLYSN